MNQSRRRFVGQCAAVVGTSAVSAMTGRMSAEAAQAQPLRNWAGNYEYSTNRITSATSLAQIQEFVRTHEHFKVLGSRHCFNGIADSADHFLSLREMKAVVALDRTARTVTVDSGMSYGQLCPSLDRDGFALHNLASLPHISIAGACATGTHGSGVNNGNLSTAVSAFEIVTADGGVLSIARRTDPRTFAASVVNLGALGVVTRVTLDVQPAFTMGQDVYLDMPMAQVRDHFEDIVSAGYSVSLFTDWQSQTITEAWIKNRLGGQDAVEYGEEFFGAKAATQNLHPIAALPAENCTEQMDIPGRWYERLPHFKMGFTPSSGVELQTEYFVSQRNAVDAILAVNGLATTIAPLLYISEIRTIAADDLWISPCYRQPTVAIHFTWKPDWNAVSQVLPLIEKELSPYAARPHWGKLFTMSPEVLASRYERLDDFRKLASTYDPKGKFRNDFLNKYIFRE